MVIALLLLACSAEPEPVQEEMVWLEGASYAWEYLNHRVSYVSLGTSNDVGWASVIGGTSTTGAQTALADECDLDTCREFPFIDNAHVTLDWGRAITSKATFVRGSVDVLADVDGGSTTLELVLPERAKGESTALITGFTIDTHHPLRDVDDACYHPENGWHPRRIFLEVGAPTRSEGRLLVDVDAAFEAGNALEEVRQCVDAVADLAQVVIRVDVLVVTTEGAVSTADYASSASYEHEDANGDNPEQIPPVAESLGWGLKDAVAGWSSLDFRFHVDDPELRGAYLRTLSFDVDVEADSIAASATNYSPGTQLSGFDYSFEGAAVGVEVGGTVTHGTALRTIPVELDPTGRPVHYDVSY